MDIVVDAGQPPSFEQLMCLFTVASMLVMSPLVPSLNSGLELTCNFIADETNTYIKTTLGIPDIIIPPEYLGHAVIFYIVQIRLLLDSSRNCVTFEGFVNKKQIQKPKPIGAIRQANRFVYFKCKMSNTILYLFNFVLS